VEEPFVIQIGVPIYHASDKVGYEAFFRADLLGLNQLLKIQR